jgi:asparagine synthase (glutamine-hydrolysing)
MAGNEWLLQPDAMHGDAIERSAYCVCPIPGGRSWMQTRAEGRSEVDMGADIYAVIAKTPRAADKINSALFDPRREFFNDCAESWWRSACGSAAIANAEFDGWPDGNAFCCTVPSFRNTERYPAAWVSTSPPRDATGTIPGSGLYAGPYAAAQWVHAERALFGYRDLIGQAPLYYADRGEFYLLSTSLPALLAATANIGLNREAAFQYLSFGLPGQGRCLAHNITKVPAAHFVRFQMGCVPITSRYFTPLALDQDVRGGEKASSRIRSALADSRARLREFDSAALLLSGGIDSSCIAAILSEDPKIALTAYTIGFSEAHIASEVSEAEQTAAHFDLEHRAVVLDIATATRRLDEILEYAEPCSAWSTLVHAHLVERIAQDGHAMLVSGLGADEVFGGYQPFIDYYWSFRDFVRSEHLPSPLEGIGEALRRTRMDGFLFPGVPTFFDAPNLKTALDERFGKWSRSAHVPAFYAECLSMKPNAHYFEMMTAYECQNRIPDLLLSGFGQINRAYGMNDFYPFLVPDILKAGCALAPNQKLELIDEKWKGKKFLRALARTILPPFIFDRKVQAYSAPIREWLRDQKFFQAARGRLMDSKVWNLGLFQGGYREELHAELLGAVEFPNSPTTPEVLFRFWAVLTLGAWCDRFNAS